MPDDDVLDEETEDDTEEETEEEDDTYEVSDESEDEDEADEDADEDLEDEEEKDEESTDDKMKELSEVSDKIESAKTHHKQLSKAIEEAKGTLHRIRQEKKTEKSDGDETVFTDAQLQAILEEHPNEAGVQLQVLKQMMKQGLSGVEENAEKRAESTARKNELNGYLTDKWPELNQEDSEMRLAVNETKGHMDIEEHPYGDFLATGAHLLMNVNEFMERAKEEGRTEALKGKVEKSRKDKIKSNKLPDSGNKKGSDKVVLSSDHEKTAKQIGLNKRQKDIYAKMMKKGRTLTVEV